MKLNYGVWAVLKTGDLSVELIFCLWIFLLYLLPGVREYRMAVIRSPAIPFDAGKKPGQGVLKSNPTGSRINPFYKLNRKKKLNSSFL